MFEMQGPLLIDTLCLQKYLIHGVVTRNKMYWSKSPLVIMSAEDFPDYRLDILEETSRLCKVSVDTGVALSNVELFA